MEKLGEHSKVYDNRLNDWIIEFEWIRNIFKSSVPLKEYQIRSEAENVAYRWFGFELEFTIVVRKPLPSKLTVENPIRAVKAAVL